MADMPCRVGIKSGGYYADLPANNDALVLMLLRKVGQANATNAGDIALQKHLSFAAMLQSGTGNQECSAVNYQRIQISTGATTVWNDGERRWDCYFPSQALTNLGTSTQQQEVQKLVIGYWPTVGTGGDAAILPLAHADYFKVCDGTTFTLDMPSGYLRLGGV